MRTHRPYSWLPKVTVNRAPPYVTLPQPANALLLRLLTSVYWKMLVSSELVRTSHFTAICWEVVQAAHDVQAIPNVWLCPKCWQVGPLAEGSPPGPTVLSVGLLCCPLTSPSPDSEPSGFDELGERTWSCQRCLEPPVPKP